MTLAEVMVATAILAMVFGSSLAALSRLSYRAYWAGCSLSATQLAELRMEQMQSARWDPLATPAVDELMSSNFPSGSADLFAYTGGGTLVASTMVNIVTMPNTNSPQYKVLSSSVIWSYRGRGPFTNTVTSIRSMSQ